MKKRGKATSAKLQKIGNKRASYEKARKAKTALKKAAAAKPTTD